MDWKRSAVCGIMVLVVVLGAVPAFADHGIGCTLVPSTMATFNCSDVDMQMLDLKIRLGMAETRRDWTEWNALAWEMRLLESNADYATRYDGTEPLTVRADASLEHHQSLDFARVGPNIRYVTAPSSWDGIMPRFIIHDSLGRQTKISGLSCTSNFTYWMNFAVSTGATSGGALAGVSAAAGAWALSVPVKLLGWGGIALGVGSALYGSLPEAETCIVLVDVLNPEGDGYVVYRNRSVISKDGTITIKKQANTGLIWWQIGPVVFDEAGNPVW